MKWPRVNWDRIDNVCLAIGVFLCGASAYDGNWNAAYAWGVVATYQLGAVLRHRSDRRTP